MYKAKARERVAVQTLKKDPPKMMMVCIYYSGCLHNKLFLQIILGGMVYDHTLCKGVRKKYLPEPNPTKVELKRETKYHDLLGLARRIYFSEFQESTDSLSLADSSGMPISVADETMWTLGSFYSANSLQPSRYKLYVVIKVVFITHSVARGRASQSCGGQCRGYPQSLTLGAHAQ